MCKGGGSGRRGRGDGKGEAWSGIEWGVGYERGVEGLWKRVG